MIIINLGLQLIHIHCLFEQSSFRQKNLELYANIKCLHSWFDKKVYNSANFCTNRILIIEFCKILILKKIIHRLLIICETSLTSEPKNTVF